MSGTAPQPQKTSDTVLLETILSSVNRIETKQDEQARIASRLVAENIVIRSNYRTLTKTMNGIGKIVTRHEKTINIAAGAGIVFGSMVGFIATNWKELMQKVRN